MVGKRRQFTQEFKASAGKLVTEQGYKRSEAAPNFNIHFQLRRNICGAGKRNLKQ